MSTLLVGNNKFIIESLAERFLFDNKKVGILGEFESPLSKNILKKAIHYDIGLMDSKCKKLFEAYTPKTLIYCNGLQRENSDDKVSVNERINEFINIFTLATNNSVEKLIYISSTDLSDEQDHELEHMICESHIKNAAKLSKIKTLIIRTDQVYGCRQDHSLVSDSIFSKEAQNNKEISGVYIKDFADMVYQYNRHYSEGEQSIIAKEIAKASDIQEYANKINLGEEGKLEVTAVNEDDYKQVEDTENNIKIRLNTGLEKGIAQTIQYDKKDTTQIPKIKMYKNAVSKKLSPVMTKETSKTTFLMIVINILLFGLVAYLCIEGEGTMLFGLVDIRVLYILIISATMGFMHSILSTLFSIGLVIYMDILTGTTLTNLEISKETLYSILLFSLVGLIIGYVRDVSRQKLKESERAKEEAIAIKNHTVSMMNESLRVRDALQEQVLNSEDSYGKVFSIASQLNSLDMNKLRGDIIRIFETVLDNETIALYLLSANNEAMRLVGSSKGFTKAKKSIFVNQDREINEVITKKMMFVKRDVAQESDYAMIAPIKNDEQVVALIVVHETKIMDMTLHYQNLFEMTVKLVTNSVVNAYEHQKVIMDKQHDEKSGMLKREFFKEKLAQSKELQKNGVADYTLLSVDNDNTPELCNTIISMLREHDWVGEGETGNLMIIVSNSSREEAQNLRMRLSSKSIFTRVEESEE